MNLLKNVPLAVASLLVAASAFGQERHSSQKTMMEAPSMPTMAGYNAPDWVKVQGDYDFFIQGSFIYWQPMQDNMEVAFANQNSLSQITSPGFDGYFVLNNLQYKPGFQLGIGMDVNYDGWDTYVEYTRVHGQHNVSANAPTGGFLMPTFGHPYIMQNSQTFNSVSSSFQCNFDFLDFEARRAYYLGQNLTVRATSGIRAAWILEKVNVDYVQTGAVSTSAGTPAINSKSGEANVNDQTHSWALGPKVGCDMNWMLGQGIRFFGSGSGDLLYTKYNLKTKTALITYVTSPSGNAVGVPQFGITRSKPGVVRAHVDLEMGLGWGTYFDDNNWHVDLSASYGFQVFFDQNMFRHFDSNTMVGLNTTPTGNLYVQGLTATARFDF